MATLEKSTKRTTTKTQATAKPKSTKAVGTKVEKRQLMTLTEEKLNQLIAERAYFKAAERGFFPGGELSDWFDSEKEVLQSLLG